MKLKCQNPKCWCWKKNDMIYDWDAHEYVFSNGSGEFEANLNNWGDIPCPWCKSVCYRVTAQGLLPIAQLAPPIQSQPIKVQDEKVGCIPTILAILFIIIVLMVFPHIFAVCFALLILLASITFFAWIIKTIFCR